MRRYQSAEACGHNEAEVVSGVLRRWLAAGRRLEMLRDPSRQYRRQGAKCNLNDSPSDSPQNATIIRNAAFVPSCAPATSGAGW
jgi:hypothetical protein